MAEKCVRTFFSFQQKNVKQASIFKKMALQGDGKLRRFFFILTRFLATFGVEIFGKKTNGAIFFGLRPLGHFSIKKKKFFRSFRRIFLIYFERTKAFYCF